MKYLTSFLEQIKKSEHLGQGTPKTPNLLVASRTQRLRRLPPRRKPQPRRRPRSRIARRPRGWGWCVTIVAGLPASPWSRATARATAGNACSQTGRRPRHEGMRNDRPVGSATVLLRGDREDGVLPDHRSGALTSPTEVRNATSRSACWWRAKGSPGTWFTS